jgi:hypothetical protein
MGAQAALATARAWWESAGSGRPHWQDVELVVALDLDESALGELMLFDVAALRRAWASIPRRHSMVPETQAEPARTLVEPASEDAVPDQPAATPEQRLERLTAWHASALAAGRQSEIGGLGAADLSRIANSSATTPAELRGLMAMAQSARKTLRAHAEEISTVLRGEDPATAPKPPPPHTDPQSAPRPAPVATAAPSMSEPPSSRGLVAPEPFARFDYLNLPDASRAAKVQFEPTPDEQLRVSWPPFTSTAGVSVFRVVTSEEFAPVDSPDLGTTLAATTATEVLDEFDTSGVSRPVRYFAVWLNQGATEEAARAAQPTLHAYAACVLPVRRCQIREDTGIVVGQWETSPGVVEVEVHRVLVRDAAQTTFIDSRNRVNPAWVSLGGFSDREPLAGEEVEYRVYAKAPVADGSEEYAPFVSTRVQVTANVMPVNDLTVSPVETADRAFDLRWTMPPIGDVEIYRTQEPPAAGLDRQMVDRSRLEKTGFTHDVRLIHALDRNGTGAAMHNVPWPPDWAKAYFTPVTVVSETQVRVGKSQILAMPRSVGHVRLLERVDEQVVMFSWPEGTTSAKFYHFNRGAQVQIDLNDHMPFYEITQDQYDKFGGAHLPTLLPGDGCTVYVVATSYSSGRAVLAPPVAIDYPGLRRIRYRLEEIDPSAGGRLRRPRQEPRLRQLVVRSDQALAGVTIVLVHNATRLPLYLQDGQELGRMALDTEPAVPRVMGGPVDLSSKPGGFVRLFVDVPAEDAGKYAVLDPAVAELRCG